VPRPIERGSISGEFFRRAAAAPVQPAQKNIPRAPLAVGTRVRHAVFGDGEILTRRDMGGDILYEVRFDDGTVKKLMATYAKLEPLN